MSLEETVDSLAGDVVMYCSHTPTFLAVGVLGGVGAVGAMPV